MKRLDKKLVQPGTGRHSNRRGSVGCAALLPLFIGVIFTTVGFCVMFFWGWPVLQKAKASTSWPSVKGVVTSSRVVQTRGDKGVSYRPEVLFDYTVDGEKYSQGNVRYDGNWSTNVTTYANRVVNKYKVGTEVNVYYDPADPFEAVLEPGTTWLSYLPIGFGAVFFLIGSGLLLGPAAYLFLGMFLAGGAATGMVGKSPSSRESLQEENPYANPDSWEDDNRDDGFENI